MSPISINTVKELLREYARQSHQPVDLILIGGLALQAYGVSERVTVDVDGELAGMLQPLVDFLVAHQIPVDLGENISGWSIVAMPPGYRDRTSVWYEEGGLRIKLLHPVDFIIAKLRRGTDQDLDDAREMARRFQVTWAEIQAAAHAAIEASPKDTALFTFRKIVENFGGRLDWR